MGVSRRHRFISLFLLPLLLVGMVFTLSASAAGPKDKAACVSLNKYPKVDCFRRSDNAYCGSLPAEVCYESGNCTVCGGTCNYIGRCDTSFASCCQGNCGAMSILVEKTFLFSKDTRTWWCPDTWKHP